MTSGGGPARNPHCPHGFSGYWIRYFVCCNPSADHPTPGELLPNLLFSSATSIHSNFWAARARQRLLSPPPISERRPSRRPSTPLSCVPRCLSFTLKRCSVYHPPPAEPCLVSGPLLCLRYPYPGPSEMARASQPYTRAPLHDGTCESLPSCSVATPNKWPEKPSTRQSAMLALQIQPCVRTIGRHDVERAK